jgi:hypothetical protein
MDWRITLVSYRSHTTPDLEGDSAPLGCRPTPPSIRTHSSSMYAFSTMKLAR